MNAPRKPPSADGAPDQQFGGGGAAHAVPFPSPMTPFHSQFNLTACDTLKMLKSS